MQTTPVLKQATLTQMYSNPSNLTLPPNFLRTRNDDDTTEFYFHKPTNTFVDSIERANELHNSFNQNNTAPGSANDLSMPTPGVPGFASMPRITQLNENVDTADVACVASALNDLSKNKKTFVVTPANRKKHKTQHVQSPANNEGWFTQPTIVQDNNGLSNCSEGEEDSIKVDGVKFGPSGNGNSNQDVDGFI